MWKIRYFLMKQNTGRKRSGERIQGDLNKNPSRAVTILDSKFRKKTQESSQPLG
jgi:hypothetical protein